ncbi:MAG: DegT/DnrJ/EryC1/StrS family aminotransferase, partial [Bacteroidales bacterium]
EVAVNVHFQPLPMLSIFKEKGYKMDEYPIAYDNYAREISLPVWYGLTPKQTQEVIRVVVHAVEKVLGTK